MYTGENCPYSLKCGHNLCKNCKENMILNKTPCPYDSSHTHSEDDIARNFDFIHIMEDISKIIKINKHKNKSDKELDDFIKRLKQRKKMFASDGIIYKGALKDDKPFGSGQLTHKKIGTFKGIFDGEYHKGNGSIYYNDGCIYEGKWMNYKRQGHGVLHYPNLDIYDGEFKDDLFNGKGKYFINAEKITKQGVWKQGKKEGLFNILNDKGEIITTENYKNDKKI